MKIREDIPAHMAALWRWLEQTRDEPLEDMDGFFAARIGTYEEHMAGWAGAYEKLPSFLPADCGAVLDLGCGTGLELDALFRRFPALSVTGIDCCAAMLEKLREKYAGCTLTLRCADYLTAEFGTACFDAVISVESLHHFTPAQKAPLFRRIWRALRPGGLFVEADYIACCEEEETLLRGECDRRRAAQGVWPDRFVHFDTPLTLAHELSLLREAGFSVCDAPDSVAGATFVRGQKG